MKAPKHLVRSSFRIYGQLLGLEYSFRWELAAEIAGDHHSFLLCHYSSPWHRHMI